MISNEQRIIAIKKRLEALDPTFINIIDDSAKHAGHAGAQSGAGHFTLEIASAEFTGKTPVACHRMIYDAIGNLMGSEIHALSIKLNSFDNTALTLAVEN